MIKSFSFSLIVYVPKYAMLPATAALFSSAVAVVRLLEANLGMSARVMTSATRPLLVRITLPFASDPKGSVFVPPWSRTLDFIVQVPTTCCLSEPFFSLPACAANPKSATAANARHVRQFVFMANPLAGAGKASPAGKIPARPGEIGHRSRGLLPSDAQQLHLEDERDRKSVV